MIQSWQVDALIELLQKRYPTWQSFADGAFQQDEIKAKRQLSARVQAELGKATLSDLLKRQHYQTIMQRVGVIGRKTALLYNRTPKQGDLNILYADGLDSAEFSHHFYKLLHDPTPISDRLHRWQHFTQANHLPCKWGFTTFFLFLHDPSQHILVKPRVARWFLRFIGAGDAWTAQLHPTTYTLLQKAVLELQVKLADYGATDLIDVQSLIWVAYRESKGATGQLPPQAQIALDQPPTVYRHRSPEPLGVREDSADYMTLPTTTAPALNPPITLAQTAAHLLRDKATVHAWRQAIERKGQLIFYGPPGTGKTYAAQALAQQLISGGNGFVELLQLHPNYSYEEFIEGLRPIEKDGQIIFKTISGRFVDFCQRAEKIATHAPCVLILDEINRADLARIFGELLYLLEYRDQPITLASGTTFRIPRNIRIIGTMNTADRSIALVDYALRRRFAFVALAPDYNILRRFHKDSDFPIETLITILKNLNALIEPEYQLGCSYFLTQNLPSELPLIWQHEIEPYIDEYFYASRTSAEKFHWQTINPPFLAALRLGG